MHTYEPSCKMTTQGYARASLCPKASGPGRENGYNSDGTNLYFFSLGMRIRRWVWFEARCWPGRWTRSEVFIKSFPKNFQDRLHEVVKVSKPRESSEVGKKRERSLLPHPVLPHYALIQTIHLWSIFIMYNSSRGNISLSSRHRQLGRLNRSSVYCWRTP